MTDIAAFLTARLDEDELKVAGMQREMTRARTAPIYAPHRDAMLGHLAGIDIFVSPERGEAEIAAKRKILGLHKACDEPSTPAQPECIECAGGGGFGADWPCRTLLLLAEPYSDHEDYDPNWGVT